MVVVSNIIKQGQLVSYEEWCSYIDSLHAQVTEQIADETKAVNLLTPLLEKAVLKRVPKEPIGIMFSGGVDSTTIAYILKKHKVEFICYTVGIEGSKDLEVSFKVAQKLGFALKTHTLSLEEMDILFRKTVKIVPKDKLDTVSIGVGAVVLGAIELAAKDNITHFFGGLGSEEIFAGYHRHEQSTHINDECWQGLKSTWQRDFTRDVPLAKETKTTFYTPFLDKDLIIGAMSIDAHLKIKNNYKKYILRKVSESLGVPNEFAWRPKKAAQYGSNFDKALLKLAKQHGFRYKKEYLNYLSEN